MTTYYEEYDGLLPRPGDDVSGNWGSGRPRSLTPAANTWYDSYTGLTWARADNGSAVTYANALTYQAGVNAAGLDGYTDFRIPNDIEIRSIHVAGAAGAAGADFVTPLQAGTVRTSGDVYWTSTGLSSNSGYVLDFVHYYRTSNARAKTGTARVLLCRGGNQAAVDDRVVFDRDAWEAGRNVDPSIANVLRPDDGGPAHYHILGSTLIGTLQTNRQISVSGWTAVEST